AALAQVESEERAAAHENSKALENA
ncbi:MAG: hypothetical protein QOC95_1444, partial [Thermoleophilaceae bacterium]|nr:hypothetical protein [Thermoleophilaceae bacterium]